MNNNNINKEIIEEEYILGKEYYNKILKRVKREEDNKYK